MTFNLSLWSLLSASMLLKQAEELAATYPNTIPVMLDAGSQEGHLDSLIKDHDLVIRYNISVYFSKVNIKYSGYFEMLFNI